MILFLFVVYIVTRSCNKHEGYGGSALFKIGNRRARGEKTLQCNANYDACLCRAKEGVYNSSSYCDWIRNACLADACMSAY